MRAPAAAVLLTIAALAGCSSGTGTVTRSQPRASPVSPAPPAPGLAWWRTVPPTGWPAYHANAGRTGDVAGLPAARRLSVAWSARLDGAVYGQPLVIGSTVIAATENDSIYGLARSTGRVLWRTRVGTPLPLADQPCGDIDPIGITSTPVYDRARGLVFAVAQDGRATHVLVGLTVSTGAVRYRRDVPSPDGQPYYDQQRASLALDQGRIYVAFGGHAGDCGPYEGSVVGMPDHGQAQPAQYLVPSHNHAGIWAPAGPVIAPDGTIFVAVGNGDESGSFDDSDSVTALSPDLHRIGVFAPRSWVPDNVSDLDLGSMSPVLFADGYLLQAGKRGTGYLLRAGHLGGIGGQLAQRPVCAAFGGAAIAGTTAYLPCADGGMAAVSVAAGTIAVRWRGPDGAAGSPVIGGGAVWVTDYDRGILYQLSPQTGRVRQQLSLRTVLPHFESPSLSGALVLVGTMHGVVAVAGA